MNKDNDYGHKPVLLAQAIEGMQLKSEGFYVDATFGRGGHSDAILQALGPGGTLLAFDLDPEAVVFGRQRFQSDPRFSIVHSSYARLQQELEDRDRFGTVDGILLDLGVSSPQLDDPQRGFSFQANGPLDMRMNNSSGVTAGRWLQHVNQKDLADVLRNYGEERYANRIASGIVSARKQIEIDSTGKLAALIKKIVPTREQDKHPATRTFQAIRIFINRELEDLKLVLEQVVDALAPGGRLAVISFHSLEDRMVKRFIRNEVRGDPFPSELPVTQEQLKPRMKMIEKALHADDAELAGNPRARSAVLRIAEKLPP
ncbi:MAG: 16S rRNA (cytosine(1402)-N(4))-methyltransferase RsmH [Thiotrichales bacterium]|nr:16S rRNA (cytosine(1402)-N(4))-methyltransferase RsmH [Thiotrichales bacterium]